MWPFDSENKEARIGRLSPLDVEIDDPVGDWYYFGPVEMFDTEVEIGQGDEKKKRKIYFYRILTKHREDEKIVVSTDDFVQNSDHVPYTRTKKGKTRLLQLMMVAYAAVELLTMYLSYLFVQAGPNIQYYPQVVSSLEWDFGTIAFLFVAVVVIWAWSARYHHFVMDWGIQPVVVNAEKAKADLYVLTNSSRIPVVEKISELMKLPKEDIETFVHAIRLFQEDVIRDLTDQNATLNDRLNKMDIEGFAIGKKSLEMSLATREQRMVEHLNFMKWITVSIVMTIFAGFVVYLAMGGRL